MREDTNMTITQSFLVSIGVDILDSRQVQAAIYACGGSPYDYSIIPDANVRCKDKPYMCRKDTLYVAKRRRNPTVGNICGEGENVDVSADLLNQEYLKLCNSLDYTENYSENRQAKLLMQRYLNKTKKRGPNKRGSKNKHTGYTASA